MYNGLRQVPPETVAALLKNESAETGGLLLCTSTDIDNLGSYRQIIFMWLMPVMSRKFVSGLK
jgi:hypothetical protein